MTSQLSRYQARPGHDRQPGGPRPRGPRFTTGELIAVDP